MTSEEKEIDSQEAQELADEQELLAPERPEPYITQLPVSLLLIDPKIQRHISKERVSGIAQRYNPDAVGIFTGSRREDGKYYALDGQHRKAALELLNKHDEVIQLRVFEQLTPAMEAMLFRLLNNTKRPQPADIFKVKLVERDPLAMRMFAILVKYEWKVRSGNRDGYFGAVKTLEKLFRVEPDLAEAAVSILSSAWGNRYGALNDALLAGMGRLLLVRGNEVDGSRLIEKLSKVAGGPQEVINKAATMRSALKISREGSVAMILIDIYNEGARSKKLDAWKEK